MSGPLATVLAALSAGSTTTAEVAARTGLSPDLVRACTDHLARLGRVEVLGAGQACAASGCGGCPVASAAVCGRGRTPA